MPLPYSEVLTQWDRSRAFGDPRDLTRFASDMNAHTGTQDYVEGLRDGPWTRMSTRADQILQGTSPYGDTINMLGSAPADVLGVVGGGIGGMFDNEAAGERVGRQMPRALLNSAPLYLANPVVGALGTGALMAAHTYADTGSAKAATISGVTGALLPAVGRIGGAAMAEAFGGGERLAGQLADETTGVTKPFNEILPKTSADVAGFKAAHFLGSQVSQIALNQASMYATDKTLGQEYNPANPDFWLQQIPFTAFDVVHAMNHEIPTVTSLIRHVIPAKEVERPLQPFRPADTGTEEDQMALTEMLNRVAGLKTVAAAPDEVGQALAALQAVVADPAAVRQAKLDAYKTTPISLAGRAQQFGDSWKMEVNDAQGDGADVLRLPEHKNVWINHPDVKLDAESGQHVFHGTLGDLGGEVKEPLKPVEEAKAPVTKVGGKVLNPDENPALPIQEKPAEGALTEPVKPVEEAKTPVAEEAKTPVAEATTALTEPEMQSAREAGVSENTLMQLVDTQKKDSLGLDMVQGPIQRNAEGNVVRIGNSDVAKDGWMNKTRFEKVTMLPKGLVDTLPGVVEGDKVHVGRAVEELGKMVEVKKLGKGSIEQTPEDKRYAELTHIIDTNPQRQQIRKWLLYGDDEDFKSLSPEAQKIALELNKLGNVPDDMPEPSRPTTKYSDVSPKNEEDMPGYVEGLVRLRGDTLYHGDHFGAEDNNVLAFYRGYEETMPNGKKAFHVIEVQSDWAQARSKIKKGSFADEGGATSDHPLLASYESLALRAAIMHAREIGADYIVLSDGETAMMTEGHDAVANAISPAKPAVIKTIFAREHEYPEESFGPDWESGTYVKFRDIYYRIDKPELNLGKLGQEIARELVPYAHGGTYVPQQKGMDAAYDVRLPNILAKLTGDKGMRVNLGIHKMASHDFYGGGVSYFDTQTEAQEYAGPNGQVARHGDAWRATRLGQSKVGGGSPVFRNPDGTPKSSITGRQYLLSNINEGLSHNDTLSLREAVQAVVQAKQAHEQTQAELRNVITNPPSTVAAIAANLPNPGPVLARAKENGTPIAIAVQNGIVAKKVAKVDEAAATLKQTQKQVELIERETRGKATLQRLKDLASSTESTPEVEQARKVIAEYAKALSRGKANNIEQQLNRILASVPEDGKLDVKRLRGAFNTAANRRNVGSRGAAVSDPVTGKIQMTNERANEVIKELKIGDTHEPVRKRESWVIQNKVTRGNVSLDADRGKGMNLHNTITSAFDEAAPQHEEAEMVGAPEEYTNEEQDKKIDNTITAVQERVAYAAKAPAEFARLLRKDVPTSLRDLAAYRLMLEHQATADHVLTVDDVNELVEKYNEEHDTELPDFLHEKELAEWKRSVHNALDGFAGQQLKTAAIAKYLKLEGTVPEHQDARVKAAESITQGDIVPALTHAEEVHGALTPDLHDAIATGTVRDVANAAENVLADDVSTLENVTEYMLGTVRATEAGIKNTTTVDNATIIAKARRKFLQDYQEKLNKTPEQILEQLKRDGIDTPNAKKVWDKGSRQSAMEREDLQDDFNFAVLRDLTQHFNKQQGMKLGGTERGSVDFSPIRDAIDLIHAKLKALVAAIAKHKKALVDWMGLNNFTQEGADTLHVRVMTGEPAPNPPNSTDAVTHKIGGQALGLVPAEPEPQLTAAQIRTQTDRAQLEKSNLTKFSESMIRACGLTQFTKQQFPAFAQVASSVSRLMGDRYERFWNHAASYAGLNSQGKLDQARIDSNERVHTNPTLAKVANTIHSYAQTVKENSKNFTWDSPYVKDAMKGLNQSDRQAIMDEHDSHVNQQTYFVDVDAPQHFDKVNGEMVSKAIVGSEPGMLPEQGRAIANQLFTAMKLAKDPATQLSGMEQLRALGSQMQPQTYVKALNLAEGLTTDAQKFLDFARKNLHFVSEQRFGDYLVRMQNPDKTVYMASFDSEAKALARVKEKEAQGATFISYIPRSETNAQNVRPDVMAQFQALDTQAAARITELFKNQPDVLDKVLPMVQRASDYAGAMAAFDTIPGVNRRKLVSGRDEINMMDNAKSFFIKTNQWMMHREVRATTDVDMLHPELAGNRVLLDYSRQHVENFLAKDNQIARMANEITFHTKLAFNFGVNFLHGIQSLTTGMSGLIAETGHVGDAFERIAGAVKAISGRAVSGKWENPEHEWITDYAKARGLTNGFNSFDGASDDATNRMMSAVRNNGFAGKAVEKLLTASKGWTSYFSQFNSQVSMIAAFDLARERGMDKMQAAQFAQDVKERSLFDAGKAGRSVGTWSIKTKAVPQLMHSLQGYTQGWFNMFAANYRNGFTSNVEGLTPTQKLGAKKALMYQLGCQAVLAGAIGLPGMGQGIAVLKQASGLDLNAWTRQNLAKLFDEDQDNGGIMTSLALHGAVANFTPMDPSGRHMPSIPFIGISPYNGFSLANLASSPVSAAADVVRGVLAAANGDMQGAKSALPHVLQGPFQLYTGEGDARDGRGNLITRLSPAEQFVTALGMTPSRVAQARESAVAVQELNKQAAQAKQAQVQSIARTFRNDSDSGRVALRDYLGAHPDEDGVALAKEIALAVQKQSMPVDTRMLANPGADLAGLQSTGELPSYQDRVQQLQQTQSALGVLPSRTAGMTMMRAGQVQDVMDANPYAGLQEAKQQVQQQFSRPSRKPQLQFAPAPGLFESGGY